MPDFVPYNLDWNTVFDSEQAEALKELKPVQTVLGDKQEKCV
jgi:hypothetical protein